MKDELLTTLSTLSNSVATMMHKPSVQCVQQLRHLCSEIVSLLAILLHIPAIDVDLLESESFIFREVSITAQQDESADSVVAQVENQITSILQAIKQLVSEHSKDLEVTTLQSDHDSSSKTALSAYKQLRSLFSVRVLRDDVKWQKFLATLRSPACVEVMHALQRIFATTTPGSEPENNEAKRQLFFFINSMYNHWMPAPVSVRKMKPCSTLTPHFEEEVAYSADALNTVGDEGVNLEHLLQVQPSHSIRLPNHKLLSRTYPRGDAGSLS